MSIYFLRHGESKSNEQNRFAGRFDSPLTELGRKQAARAAQELNRLKIHFDEVHVSPLVRAKETAAILLAQVRGEGVLKPVFFEAAELIERDFGTLSEKNKSLIKKTYGHGRYEEMFHRSGGAAPGGESFADLHDRISEYYFRVLKPASDAGRTVLVVAHKYSVEMFALIAADLKPDQYFDFKIPNSKPSSFEELGRFAKNASPAAQASTEIMEIHLSKFLLVAAVAGILLKQIFALKIASPLAVNLITGLFLAINSFLSVLRLDRKVITSSFSSLRDSRAGILLRAVTGIAAILILPKPIGTLVGVYFLLPPAMTAPTLSLMWGGDYFFSAKLTGALSVMSITVLFLLVRCSNFFGHGLDLSFGSFMLLFSGAVLVPGFFAQMLRMKNPIRAGAIATNQGWLGGAALIPLAFLSTYLLTPVLNGAFLNFERTRILTELLGLVTALLLSRLIARFAAKTTRGDASSQFDVYLCQLFPNIFLFTSLLPASDRVGLFLPLLNLLFFLGICFEEAKVVRAFGRAEKLTAPELRGVSAYPAPSGPSPLASRAGV